MLTVAHRLHTVADSDRVIVSIRARELAAAAAARVPSANPARVAGDGGGAGGGVRAPARPAGGARRRLRAHGGAAGARLRAEPARPGARRAPQAHHLRRRGRRAARCLSRGRTACGTRHATVCHRH